MNFHSLKQWGWSPQVSCSPPFDKAKLLLVPVPPSSILLLLPASPSCSSSAPLPDSSHWIKLRNSTRTGSTFFLCLLQIEKVRNNISIIIIVWKHLFGQAGNSQSVFILCQQDIGQRPKMQRDNMPEVLKFMNRKLSFLFSSFFIILKYLHVVFIESRPSCRLCWW